MKWIGIVLLATLQAPAIDDPKSLRGNEMYSKTTMMIARDICSDHDGDTKVWIIDYRSQRWMNVTCDMWARADK